MFEATKKITLVIANWRLEKAAESEEEYRNLSAEVAEELLDELKFLVDKVRDE